MSLTLEALIEALAAYRPPAEAGRHDLTDGQWAAIEHWIPKPETRRGLPRDPRRMLDGMLWILRTGAPWRDLPARYGPWQTVWHRFNKWRREGVLAALREELLGVLDEQGELDWGLWCVDGTSIRASRSAAGARKGG